MTFHLTVYGFGLEEQQLYRRHTVASPLKHTHCNGRNPILRNEQSKSLMLKFRFIVNSKVLQKNWLKGRSFSKAH